MKYLIGAALAFTLVGIFSFSSKTASPEISVEKKASRVVFHLSSPDTAAHRALAIQLNNVLEGIPNAQLEVVVHNKGITMLQTQKSTLAPELDALKKRGVQFMACEHTMKRLKLEKADMLPLSGFVPSGLVEIIRKQEEGWSYVKAGF